MPYVLRGVFVSLLLILLVAGSSELNAQCVGLPTVTTLGSNKFPAGFCSPVQSRVTYNVGFISNVPNGTIDIVIDWGDGVTQILPRSTGTNSYSADVTHDFPEDSDCEFLVTMALRYNGVICPTTRQVQKVASWRTDAYNGGNVRLISPVTNTNEHLVCAGQPISVSFRDLTDFNCNANYVHTAPTPIETPNIEKRWQQIVYNTVNEGGGVSVIPNVYVDGVQVTNAAGGGILTNYQDPRGVHFMEAPVVLNDPRRRNTLDITADGGFGPAFPQVGDVFEVRIRYWNFCNPYSNNPSNPSVPVNGDFINGDNPPVERTARIRIVEAPPTLGGASQTLCNGQTPGSFAVTNVQAGNVVRFYRDNAGAPGALIRSSTNPTLNITDHPEWNGNPVNGQVLSVWVTQRANTVGACESEPIRLTRTIRSAIPVPDPSIPLPAEICNLDNSGNANTFTLTLPAAAAGAVGGATEYVWNTSLPSGITLLTPATGGNAATYRVNVTFGSDPYVDRTFTISRRYTSNPTCVDSRQFTVRIYNTAVGGTPSVVPDVCETTPVGTITLNGYRGQIVRWEVSVNGGAYNEYTGPASGNSITPGLLTDGTYDFRAVVRSHAAFSSPSPCGPVYSAVRRVVVFDNPDPATAGPDQNFCGPLTSDPLGGSNPGSGTGTWSYVSSVPAGLPAPTYTLGASNPATAITVTTPGAYVMRWTVQNGSCISSDDIIVDFGGTPTTPDPGNDKSVCGPTTNLEGNTPIIGFGAWTVVDTPLGGTASITNPTSPNATVNLTGAPVYGTYKFRWTITSGSCPSLEDDVEITFFETPEAIASDVATTCIGPTTFDPITISGTIDGGADNGVWELVSGNGVVSATSLNGSNYEATYTPTIDDYNAGVPIRVKLVANPVAGSPCTPAERIISINIERTPEVLPGSDIPNICGDNVQLNAQSPPPFGATGVWTASVGSVTIDNPTQANTFVRNLPAAPSSVTMTWTLTSVNGNCTASEDVVLTRVPPPALTPFTAQECEVLPPGGPIVTTIVLQNYESSLAGLPASRSITWYQNATPPVGTVVADPSVPMNNIGNGQIFVARVTDLTTNCSSDVQVTVNVRPLPPAADAIVGICEDDPVNLPNVAEADLNTPAFINPVTGGAAGVNVRWYPTFADAQNNINEITDPVFVNGSQVVHARVEYNTTPTCPDFAELELRVNSIPNVTTIGGDPTVCMGEIGADINTLQISTYQVPSIPGAQYHWSIPDGPGQFVVFGGATTNDFFALLKFPHASPAPVETISVRIEFNGCSTPEITMDIERSEVPMAPVIDGAAVVCEDSQSIVYNVVNPDATADYIWEIQRESNLSVGGAFIASGQSTENILVNFLDENVIISVREENGSNGECVGPKAYHQVTVNRLPQMENQLWTVCSGSESGIEFQPAAGSVAIDYYNLSSVAIDPNLTINPPSPVVGNGPFDMLKSFRYKNTTEIPLKVTYKVSPVSETTIGTVTTTCYGPEQTVVLDVNPEPTLESGLGRNICSEERTEITLRTSVNSYPADRYVITSIEQTTNPGNPLVRVGAAAPENTDLLADAIFNDVWVNPGAPAQDAANPFIVTYRIAAKNSVTGCQGSPAVPVAIAVYPKPEITYDADAVCSESSVDVELSALNVSSTNTSWTWTVQSSTTNLRGAEPGSFANSNVAIIDDDVVNESFTPGTVVYRVTAVTTMGGRSCSSVLPVSVEVNPKPQVTPIPNTPICSTSSDPTDPLVSEIDLTGLEGSIADPSTTSIVWYELDPDTNPGAVIATPDNYPIGNGIPVYALVTGDAYSCSTVVPVTYTVNRAVALAITETNVNCYGANNGSIYAEVAQGGTAPFYFRKNTEPFASAPSNNYTFLALAPNQQYTITVEDSKGCSATLVSEIIEEPTPLEIQTPISTTPVECYFDADLVKDRNGAINVVASGSTGSYTYTLFPGGETNQTGTFTGLRPGSYSIVVNDLTNTACKLEHSPVIVSVPDPIEVLPVHIPQDSHGNQISCAGAENGEIHVTARGGTGVFDFMLDPVNPQNPIHQVANQPAIFTGLGAATYKITVVDMNGCAGPQSSVTIRDVPALFAGKIGTDQDVCFDQNDAAGDAQAFTEVIQPFGGPSSTYEYQWYASANGGPFMLIAGATSSTYDPDALSPFAAEGVYSYQRKIRSVLPVVDLANRPAFCDDFVGDDVVNVNVRPRAMVTLIGDAFACEREDKFYRLRLDVGSAPMRFSWYDGDFTYHNQTANYESAPYKVSDIQSPVTVGFSNIVDAYGCKADDAMISIDILSVDADFTVDADEKCAGDPFQFTYNNQPGVQYIWEFGDGTVRTFPADDPALDGTEDHTYAPGASSQGDASFIVKLTAALDGGACPNFSFQTVTVKRSIILNIIGAPKEICSGETITMTDNSTGVDSGIWYYVDQDGNRGPDLNAQSQVNFTLTNTGTRNPLEYTLHYEAQNDFGCPGPPYSYGPIRVYRAVDANFNINPNPAQIIGGLVNVTYHNTSDPLDPDFIYEWDYKDKVESLVEDGFDRKLVYSSDDPREITLKVTNPLRPQCSDTHVELLEISLENFLVDFNATRAGCYPLEVTVKNNSISADRFLWELTSTNGTNEKSALREPKFNIYDPGTYTLTLTGSNDGNPDVAVVSKTIEVFAKPLAEFFLRAGQVYTNSPVKPVNQSQFTCGDCYSWDFGDGFAYDKIFEPTHHYSLEGKYTITLTASVNYGDFDIDDDGIIDGPVVCSDETSKDIMIIDGGALKIPNAFTPNVNGPSGGVPDLNFTNDVFMPIMDGVEEFTMQIFDRWGNLIFESRDKNIGWDGYDKNGRLMPAGVYVYKMVLRLGDGQRTTKVGDVTLIR